MALQHRCRLVELFTDVVWNNTSQAIFPDTPTAFPQVLISGGGVTATGIAFGRSSVAGVYVIRGDPLTLTAGAFINEANTPGTIGEIHARVLNTGGFSVSNIRLGRSSRCSASTRAADRLCRQRDRRWRHGHQ